MITKFLIGLIIGVNCVISNMTILEILPYRLSKIGGFLFFNFMMGGLVLNVLLKYSLMMAYTPDLNNIDIVDYQWRLNFSIPFIVSIPRLIGLICFRKCESPAYFFSKYEYPECNQYIRESLADIY